VVHDLADLGVDCLQLALVEDAAVEQQLAGMVDRIALAAILVDLLLASVFGGIAHGVAAIAIGLHLEDVRPCPAAGMLDCLLAGGAYGQHVHAVDALAGYAERLA